MIQAEELVGGEWAEWYRLTPVQRWLESEKLWQTYLTLGGSLDPEPDTQSPFFDARAARPRPARSTGDSLNQILQESAQAIGLKDVDVVIKGVGAGRESSIRAFSAKGINILSIKDKTPIPFNGPKPPKPRRV